MLKSTKLPFHGGFFVALLWPAIAAADSYARVGFGYGDSTFEAEREIDGEPGTLTLAVGEDFGLVRVEGEGVYQFIDAEDDRAGLQELKREAHITAGMVNTILDLPLAGPVEAYGGGGVGFGYVELKATLEVLGEKVDRDKSSDFVFVYQALAGLRYRGEQFELSAGYRYVAADDIKASGGRLDYESHIGEVALAIRY